MVLSMLLAAAIGAQAGPPTPAGPRESFIICPGNPRCPRISAEQSETPQEQSVEDYVCSLTGECGDEGEVRATPSVPSTRGFTLSRRGARPAATAARPGPRAVRGREITFDLGAAALDEAARAYLDTMARVLAAAPATRIVISGHTDARGSREANIALGARRAAAVRDYLVGRGVSADRIDMVSYGAERPLPHVVPASNLNRRVSIEIAR